ncbi:MAG: N-(5-phosphoribosyl)anthranilate isomerase [Bacillales bacterium]|jgi:phosphoribosylanthranilate isomerase|nr:N-(5-phosphoribosyl)anthranilate isomerase [Bacillales bacterium]
MKVKICGITDIESAVISYSYGAEALGFVFANSKRKISVETAADISRKLPSNMIKVGVFVNESKKEIEQIAKKVGLTHLQLHGNESPEFCKEFSLPVIKALNIDSIVDLQLINRFECEYILIDGPKSKYNGGNGLKFNWKLLNSKDFPTKKIIIAGGLNSENIIEAIDLTSPYMVDVSSGVETNGRKDISKIIDFINKVKTN